MNQGTICAKVYPEGVQPIKENNCGPIPLRPDFSSNLVRVLAFGKPNFFISPYGKINHGLINMSSNCDVKSGLRPLNVFISFFSRFVLFRTDLFCLFEIAS